MIYACRRSVLSATVGNATPVAALLSPVARDYPSRVLSNPSEPLHFGCSIKERGTVVPSVKPGCLFFAKESAQIAGRTFPKRWAKRARRVEACGPESHSRLEQ